MGDLIADLRLPRYGFVVSSKVYFGAVDDPLPTQKGLSRKHVHDACHAALKRLRVDYLDLYYCHRPDPDTPVAETVAAMDTLVRQGKVLYWGTSEWPAEQIREAHEAARAGGFQAPTMEQPQYNLLHRERVEAEYRSEEHTSELQSLMRTSYAVFCLQKKRQISTCLLTHQY